GCKCRRFRPDYQRRKCRQRADFLSTRSRAPILELRAYVRFRPAHAERKRDSAQHQVMMLQLLFRRKSMDQLVADLEEPEHRMKKALGPIDVTALGIGAIIGAGIFATIGTAAAGDATRPGAGPALLLSFVVTGIACGFAALC